MACSEKDVGKLIPAEDRCLEGNNRDKRMNYEATIVSLRGDGDEKIQIQEVCRG